MRKERQYLLYIFSKSDILFKGCWRLKIQKVVTENMERPKKLFSNSEYFENRLKNKTRLKFAIYFSFYLFSSII